MVYRRILISTEALQGLVAAMAERLDAAYAGTPRCLVLVALEGARYFAGDLLSQVNFPVEVAYIKASSYHGTRSTGTVQLANHEALAQTLAGRDILIIDDIYDTGRTLAALLAWVRQHGPRSVKTCVLLEKDIPHAETVDIDFLGTTVEDIFVIGYGLDHNHRYRELPFVAELATEDAGD